MRDWLKQLPTQLRKLWFTNLIKFRSWIRVVGRKLKTFDYSNEIDYLDLKKLPFPTDWHRVFPYNQLFIEIGTGSGELLQHLVTTNPNKLYIGFEIVKKYAKRTFNRVRDSKNGVALYGEAYAEIPYLFKNNTVDGIYVLFPDPWHKKRHHKRRPLVEKWFRDVASIIKSGGFIYFATDWDEYYTFVLNEFEKVKDLYTIETGTYDPIQQGLISTYYYEKWVKEGRSFDYIKVVRR